jgi:ribosome biogenesis GTPase
MIGKIIKIVSNQYTVYSEGKEYEALAMGKVRLQDRPFVGDQVEFELIDEKYCIQRILERRNQMYRPAITNVDQAMIVMSAVEPDFSNVLVDRLIFLISYNDIEPVIVITKMDLIEKSAEIYKYIEDYKKSGYKVICTGFGDDLTKLKEALKDKVTVLAGQSGVGKSSLLNRLDKSFALHTQEISKALGRGKHTTRHTELFQVAGGWLADTPGFSSLDFSRIDSKVLIEKIKDFKVEEHCRFNDCQHINEPDCAIKKGVEEGIVSSLRYKNYLDVVPLCNQRKEWEL